MDAYLFFYSRLERFDYRLIYAPSKSFLPEPIRGGFIAFAREVINTDNVSNGKIEVPRWSIIRREDKILYGIGIYNKELGDCSSEFETRNIRGFFGLVFNYEKGILPSECFTLAFFQNLYSSYFMPFWHAEKKDENKINSVIQRININLVKEGASFSLKLNTNSSMCQVIPYTTIVRDAINAALGLNNIELVLGLNDIKHVTTANLLKFRNISIVGNSQEEKVLINNVKQREEFPKSKESAFNSSKHNRVHGTKSKPNERRKRISEEESDYNYLAESIYNKLRKCGINVKEVVQYLAKKCGLCINEQSTSDCDTQNSDVDEVRIIIDDNHIVLNDEVFQESMMTSKIERRNRLSAIRKELSSTEEGSQSNISETSVAPQNPDFNNLEELENLNTDSKDNLNIQ